MLREFMAMWVTDSFHEVAESRLKYYATNKMFRNGRCG